MATHQGKGFAMTKQASVSLAKAVWRGFRGRCPHCGEGRLFPRFLKVADHCEACGEELFQHRADDLPAYLVIVMVGHAVVPAILAVEMAYAPPVALQLAVWLPVTLFASLALLQPTKGAIVGLQWQTGMHGFAQAKELRDAADAGGVPVQVTSNQLIRRHHPA
jgi:uncharacterized protein (DUF983 family)